MGTEQRQVVLAYPESLAAAKRLAAILACDCQCIDIHHFPDGESRVTLPSVQANRVILYRSLDHPNDKLVELLLTTHELRSTGVEHITLVAPYLCYMRQDQAFHDGEVVSQQVIGGFLASQVEGIITVDPHLHRVQELSQAVPCQKTRSLSASPLFRQYLDSHFDDAYLLGPDSESRQWVASIAGDRYRYGVAQKQRLGDREVQIHLPDDDLHGQNVVLIDDVVSTGHTLLRTIELIRQQQPAQIQVLVSHALFADPDLEAKLRTAGVQNIISTDSIPHISNNLSLASLIATACVKN